MRILITGADGFIAKNLRMRLRELGHDVLVITRTSSAADLASAADAADFVFHIAGTNRPREESAFLEGNTHFTQVLCEALAASGRTAPVVYASSMQATLDNPYGRSKLLAERALLAHSQRTGRPVAVFRLVNVFGKWARPNYNSVVATFCDQIIHGKSPTVHDAQAPLRLVYIDDVVAALVKLLLPGEFVSGFVEAGPIYETTVGEVAHVLREFATSRDSLFAPRAGGGLVRALYATYLSHLTPERFVYSVPCYADTRGVFVEMLKTVDSGQVSYFSACAGVTRGEHYHHTKTEKFLVVQGTARFAFRHLVTDETHEIVTQGGEARIVESIPGWAHSVTNVGADELIVLLWANEVFDRTRPDTAAMKVAR